MFAGQARVADHPLGRAVHDAIRDKASTLAAYFATAQFVGSKQSGKRAIEAYFLWP